MGLLNLSRFCLAVFSVSALAADPPVPRGNVSVTVNPTTGYYSSTNSTVRLPNGVSVSPTAGGLPVVSKYSGGLQQQIPMGITIDAIKKSAPLPAVVRSTTQSVKNAATGCLKSARCNVGLILAGEGLQRLFDSLDWVMDEGGNIQKKSSTLQTVDDYLAFANNVPSEPSCSSSSCDYWYASGAPTKKRAQLKPADISGWLGGTHFVVDVLTGYTDDKVQVTACAYFSGSSPFSYLRYSGTRFDGWCSYALKGTDTAVLPSVEDLFSPVSSSDIEVGVNSNYEPEPSDWPALTRELKLDDVEITSAPTLQGEPKTTTVYDADGNPHEITETNIWYDFDIRDNKSSQPALDMKARQETKTYKNGALTGTTITESTATGGSGGGGGASPQIDIPTDCDFMPTVCAFLDWVKNDDTPEEPDLSALINNRDFTESYSISGGLNNVRQIMSLLLTLLAARMAYHLSLHVILHQKCITL